MQKNIQVEFSRAKVTKKKKITSDSVGENGTGVQQGSYFHFVHVRLFPLE